MNSKDLAVLIGSVVGFLLSLLFSFWPALSDWYYGEVGKKYRGLFMVGLGALTALGIYLFTCKWPLPLGISITCDAGGLITLVLAFVAFVTANQVTYNVTPESPAKARLAEKNSEG